VNSENPSGPQPWWAYLLAASVALGAYYFAREEIDLSAGQTESQLLAIALALAAGAAVALAGVIFDGRVIRPWLNSVPPDAPNRRSLLSRRITGAAVLLGALMCLFPPWRHPGPSPAGYHFILLPPEGRVEIDVLRLVLPLLVVVGLAAAAIFLTRPPPPEQPKHQG
jgi:drug/metabolite transporter (DMT)-like permease